MSFVALIGVAALVLLYFFAIIWSTTRPGTNVTRTGSVLSLLVVGFGFCYSGHRLFSGGRQAVEGYFGATMIVVGVLCFLLFLALGELLSAAGRDPGDAPRSSDDDTT